VVSIQLLHATVWQWLRHGAQSRCSCKQAAAAARLLMAGNRLPGVSSAARQQVIACGT
jgi:hypothetical protein